jgi:hypothetical protein
MAAIKHRLEEYARRNQKYTFLGSQWVNMARYLAVAPDTHLT